MESTGNLAYVAVPKLCLPKFTHWFFRKSGGWRIVWCPRAGRGVLGLLQIHFVHQVIFYGNCITFYSSNSESSGTDLLCGLSVFFSGKWIYEVLISSQGLMQIGWCTLNCRFNQEVV